VPLALILVLLSGVGPVIAWRRATPANAKRNFRVPLIAAFGTLFVLLGATQTAHKPYAVAMFCCAAFVFGSVGQEFWRGVGARRAMSSESPPVALVSLIRRNRRRYGGYTVHIGVAVLFIGVAASTAFQHVKDVSLKPGQSTLVGGYRYTYEKATQSVVTDPNSTGAILTLGAVMDVTKHGHRVAVLRPSAGYYPAPDESQGPVGSLIGGETTAHVGLQAGLRRDIWTAIQPNIDPLQPLITKGNAVVPPSHPEYAFLVLAAIGEHYVRSSPTASFHLMNSPLVTWIWFGGFIVFAGGLTAMWPAGGHRVRARYLAHVGRDLQQA
jgi:cytochrome c-type biogenesis protein CcmF